MLLLSKFSAACKRRTLGRQTARTLSLAPVSVEQQRPSLEPFRQTDCVAAEILRKAGQIE
jgi:hypothetical protein